MPEKTQTPLPAYFLSLSLENVRSFGEKQTIWFTEGGVDWKKGGKASQWTIILGDNGVGKTTILKSLASLRPALEQNLEVLYVPSFLSRWPFEWRPDRINQQKETRLVYTAAYGLDLTSKGRNKLITNVFTDHVLTFPNTRVFIA